MDGVGKPYSEKLNNLTDVNFKGVLCKTHYIREDIYDLQSICMGF